MSSEESRNSLLHNSAELLVCRLIGDVHMLQVRFVVMGNVFPTDVRLHRKYDLKGSTYGRTAGAKMSDPNIILKARTTTLLILNGKSCLAQKYGCA